MTKPFFYSLGCQTGYFGANCKNKCIGRCLSNGICNHVDGTCIGGCQDGYIGRFCSLRKFPRPTPAKKPLKDTIFFSLHITWKLRWCKSIFSACKKGYYGANCSYVCSKNCKTCRPTDGKCTCLAGWTGHSCDRGIFNMINQSRFEC